MTAALQKSGLDYLVVTSQPSRTVKKGSTLIYALTVLAKELKKGK